MRKQNKTISQDPKVIREVIPKEQVVKAPVEVESDLSTPAKVQPEIVEPQTADKTPEKFDNLYEIGLKHHIKSQKYANDKLKGRLEMEIGKNFYEQNKTKEMIQKLHDQQLEKDFSHNSMLQAERQRFQKEIQKQHYSNYAKNDITSYINRKDDKFRAFSKDKTNFTRTLQGRKELLDQQVTLKALVQHNSRRNKFVSEMLGR